LAVATSSTASKNVKVPLCPLVTVKVEVSEGGVITAGLQGSKTTTSKVTVLVADETPPRELAIVLVNVTE